MPLLPTELIIFLGLLVLVALLLPGVWQPLDEDEQKQAEERARKSNWPPMPPMH